RRVGVNGRVHLDEVPEETIRLLRGVGSLFLPAANEPGLRTYTAGIHGLSAVRSVEIEASTDWTTVSGAIDAPTDWGDDARIHVEGDLAVAAGATLRVGAGSVVRIGPGVDIVVDGTLVVEGSRERPVLFTPEDRGAPWGGLLLRNASSLLEMTGTVLTGSGANPRWFRDVPDSGSSHRKEQSLVYLSGGARATLTDCYLLDNRGQAGHGEDAFLTMTRCLVQRCITAGQFNRGAVTLNDCALVEFPGADVPFADDDNDALYLTGGAHVLTDTLIGWALDDGVDAGSGSAGSVEVRGCWIESCYHEGLAWSEGRLATVSDTVVINCGQGIECGFGSPDVTVERTLSTANLVGARFGDNYDWNYNGFLRVTTSFLLYNRRDVWGRAWDDWSEHLSQMDVQANALSATDPSFPDNSLWQPGTDAARLAPFLPSAGTIVGVGLAVRAAVLDVDRAADGVPVRLSRFTTQPVAVDYEVESRGEVLVTDQLEFPPGSSVQVIPLAGPLLENRDAVRVRLTGATGAEITGRREVQFLRRRVLIASGSLWKYLDDGTDQGTAWRERAFDDSAWASGRAELGFGDDDEATVIQGGPGDARFPTLYFRKSFDVPDARSLDRLLVRLRRDDGAVVYLNGVEVFRSNMPEGEITFSTRASDTQGGSEEEDFVDEEVSASVLEPGRNVVAVEVHQASATSSDVSFELELQATPLPFDPEAFIRGDANGDGVLDVSDPIKVLLVLFAGSSSDCPDSLDMDDSGTLNVTDPIRLLSYLFQRGPALPAPFPGPGRDPTDDGLGCVRF
ncbi:MAG: hypothetical protein O7J95_11610, partial [Planctomycetota bacterium]|nr:hypothetical protein [Planctomycetota bacterium]